MDTQHQERNNRQPKFYLIAHKVRGEPAFDIAHPIPCPICEPIRQGLDPDERGLVQCHECEDGHWWIIGTSGHRAYPYWTVSLHNLGYDMKPDGSVPDLICAMPTDLPDHYQSHAAPGTGIKVDDLLNRLGLNRAQTPQVTRRI